MAPGNEEHGTSALPAGDVTYLFTDIEGSTRLWEIGPEEMSRALVRHDEIVSQTVAEHGGVVVRSRGEGDSFFAVFTSPVSAVTAAAAMQRRLADEDWPDSTPIAVRAALHHGAADLRAGSYYGQAVNRCARLRGLAHGGQVLLSESMVALVEAELPPESGIRDLGLHRLRDLSRREHVYQLDLDGLPQSFGPLLSLDALPHNLPTQLTSFVGREEEIVKLSEELAASRLLTLTGSGGCGKTRLGMQLAAEVAEAYADGVWMVELAPITDPKLVVVAAANVLGIREEPGRELLSTLVEWLRERRLLLLLDNCEHLVAATAAFVDTALSRCAHLRVLATSREPLGVGGEVTWRVPSLSMPSKGAVAPGAGEASDAMRLFVERAASAGGVVGEGPEELAVIAEICRRLDGIPLAIELAAARTRLLSPAQIGDRLDDRFRLLRGGARSALPRQQTLEATVDWSYELLDEDERTLLRRLSVFSGGWTLEAAESVCAGEALESAVILDLLSQLVSKSLVVVDRDVGATRYRLLETIRQYAARLLLNDAAEALTHDPHQQWFQLLAEECGRNLAAGQGASWMLLDVEYDNLRTALEWNLIRPDGAESALRLAAALGEFWDLRCALAEGRRWLELALQKAPAASPALRARGLDALGLLTAHHGEYRRAEGYFEEALELARRAGDQQVVAGTLGDFGWMLWSEGQVADARRHFEEGVALARGLKDEWLLARALYLLSHVEATEGSPRADAVAEESLALARKLGEPSLEGRSLYFLGVIAMYRGHFDAGQARMEESVAIARRVGDRWQLPWSLSFLGVIQLLGGKIDRAVPHFEEGLAIARESGNNWCVARCLGGLAWCRVLTGDAATALSLAQQSLGLSRQIGARIDTALAVSFMGDYARARGDLGEAERLHAEALADNQAMRNAWGLSQGLERLARLALDRDDPGRAAWLYGAASAIRERHDCPVPPVAEQDVAEGIAAVRSAGPAATDGWRRGLAEVERAGLGLSVPPGRGGAVPSVESAG